MKLWILSFAIITNFSTTLTSHNQTSKSIKNKLRSISRSNKKQLTQDIGKLCEFIAKTIVEQKYSPKRYDIKTNIAYEDPSHRPLGELDIVVFDSVSKKALLVIEVKCRKNHEKALVQAKRQLRRFKSMVQKSSYEPENLIIARGDETFATDLFKGAKTRVMMPKRCDTCELSEHEFDVTLADIAKLQQSIAHSLSNGL